MVAAKTVRNAGKKKKTENNMTERYLQLDPIKIAWTGLNHFISVYKVKENATYRDKIDRLRLLSKDENTPEKDKEDMLDILKKLDKIANCNLCHKEINWGKERGMVNDHKETTARHYSCHEKAETSKK